MSVIGDPVSPDRKTSQDVGISRGTEGSHPVFSIGESGAKLDSAARRPPTALRANAQTGGSNSGDERGMLGWIGPDEIGRIVMPTTPIRIHGADPVDTPSPTLGQHNREIYGDWLELSAAEIAALGQDDVI